MKARGHVASAIRALLTSALLTAACTSSGETGARLEFVADLSPDAPAVGDSFPRPLAVFQDRLYLRANDASGGVWPWYLWVYTVSSGPERLMHFNAAPGAIQFQSDLYLVG